jgi:5,10-methenyltetrahydromethanopterin hydrogenase
VKPIKRDLHANSRTIGDNLQKLGYTSDLAEAVKDADLLIEAVPEDPDIKIDFYHKLSQVAPKKQCLQPTLLLFFRASLPKLQEDLPKICSAPFCQ